MAKQANVASFTGRSFVLKALRQLRKRFRSWYNKGSTLTFISAAKLKKEKTMTKTSLVWRLKKLPTVGEVAQMVQYKILTPEEAKDIFFSDKPEDKQAIET